MPKRIQAPDGSVVEFPDNMSDQQIAAVMRREYGGPQGRSTPGATRPVTSADMAALTSKPKPPRTAPRKPPRVGPVDDVIMSGGSGVVQGVTGLVGMGGDLRQMAHSLAEFGRERGINTGLDKWMYENIPGLDWIGQRIGGPTSEQADAAVQRVTGPYHEPQGEVGRYARAGGRMLPNALVPGSAAARAASVVGPAVGGETARWATEAAGGDENAQAAAEFIGSVAGGVRPSVRPKPPRIQARAGVRRAAAPIADMRARAAEFRANGIPPAFVDVVDESGRGVIRDAASRQTPARTLAADTARQRALDLPDRMSIQARRIMSPDPRKPAEIAEDLGRARASQADAQFGAVRGRTIGGTPQQFESPLVQAAIREAARRERDPAVRQALTNFDPANVTVGQADRISRVLNGQAAAAARSGDNDLAATFSLLADDIRTPARNAVPEYGQALDNYAANSRLMGAAEKGEDFLRRNTDEFVAELDQLGPAGNPLARATARRAIERAAGENPSSAPGIARRLADAPEQQARNRALLGADAPRLQDAMRLEAQRVEYGNYISPNTGSQTFGRAQDSLLSQGADAAQSIRQGGMISFVVSKGVEAIKRAGFSDADAQRLVEAALDPNQLDDIIRFLEARRPGAGTALLNVIKNPTAFGGGLLSLSAPGAAQAGQEEPRQ